MEIKHQRMQLIIAIALMLIVLYNMGQWIWTATQYVTFEETKEAYLAKYPMFLRSAFWRTVLDIILALIAAYLFLAIRQVAKGLKYKVYTMLAALNLILAFWQLFSLM